MYGSEEMYTDHWHVSEEGVVRLILGGHEQDQHSLDKLHYTEIKHENNVTGILTG